jgi:hypothetical protein
MEDSAYQDLLSYQDIDLAIDRLLRALLDTLLVKSKLAATPKDPYANRALELRETWLMSKLTEDEPKDLTPAGYLYWFDIRTQYWGADPSPNPELATLLADPGTLETLLEQALALKQRLQLAATLSRGTESAEPSMRRGVIEPARPGAAAAASSLLEQIIAETKKHKSK